LSNILTPLSTTTKTSEAKETVQLKKNINSIKADFIQKYSV
jgi:hypothetical protein